ncbi:MAG TPA: bifunctional diaminohydroxyphosphoribosylaminopyrimidine deaminase/5-amino-6-(5-phosphoribosylamino)uracil reductase RibD [bacterium]|nr:bifunctional diaminohydroxyphosphoribosylaminopyrimidine deaminase/5-amino-6-(5-phosphoribosylamino)uracil reductase RibD [bacterium]
MEKDRHFMQRTLELARRGQGRVHPNPLVGAVLVKEDRIVGEGFHEKYGEAHAEVNALRNAADSPDGATLYVNLEPCTYKGNTPPCVPQILDAGIKRVVIGLQDPNPKVNGQGIQQLEAAGLEVVVGVLEAECFELNRGFIHQMNTGMPWVTLKLAVTIDGFIADHQRKSQWITGPKSREQVHQWRAEHNAILVGGGTIKADNPSLTVRTTSGVNPTRVIIDPEQLAPQQAKVFTDRHAETIVITTNTAGNGRSGNSFDFEQLILREDDADFIAWENILTTLYRERNILSVFVEGGAEISSSLLQSGLVNELIIMTGPKIIGQGLSPFHQVELPLERAIPWKVFDVMHFGDDVCIRYRSNK